MGIRTGTSEEGKNPALLEIRARVFLVPDPGREVGEEEERARGRKEMRGKKEEKLRLGQRDVRTMLV